MFTGNVPQPFQKVFSRRNTTHVSGYRFDDYCCNLVWVVFKKLFNTSQVVEFCHKCMFRSFR